MRAGGPWPRSSGRTFAWLASGDFEKELGPRRLIDYNPGTFGQSFCFGHPQGEPRDKGRRFVQVCAQEGADWLPFESMTIVRTPQGYSAEAVFEI
jgi:hypothetical protein